MIVDTSAVVEYLRATGSSIHLRLSRAIRAKEEFWIPSIVVQEVLQGARSTSHFMLLQRQIDQLPVFEPEDYQALHRQAALLYAQCRWRGVTVRNPIDCVVAACALEANKVLLARDRDFSEIAKIEPRLKLFS